MTSRRPTNPPAPVRYAQLQAGFDAMVALLTRLEDDLLATRVGADCNDPHHHAAWCATCSARHDAIDAYREAVLEGDLKAIEEHEPVRPPPRSRPAG